MCKGIDGTDIVEVKKGLVTLLTDDTEIKKILTHSISETVVSTYNSSLPKAEELAELEKYRPGITGELVEMMKSHQATEYEYDKNYFALENKRMDIIKELSTKEHNNISQGQIIGGAISFAVLLLAYILIDKDHPLIAVSLIGVVGTLGIITSAFTGNEVNVPKSSEESD